MTDKLTLRPDFAFKPSDFITVDTAAKQVAPAAPARAGRPLQAELPLRQRDAAPWEGLNARINVPYCYRMNEVTHAKIKWVADNVPGYKSIQQVIDKGVQELVERLLRQHYPDYRG